MIGGCVGRAARRDGGASLEESRVQGRGRRRRPNASVDGGLRLIYERRQPGRREGGAEWEVEAGLPP